MKHLINTFTLAALLLLTNTVFADITINGDKTIKTTSSTIFKVDDKMVTETEFTTKAEGQVATVSAKDSDNGADAVNTENHIKGPVTSLDPFQVFGQDVVINADTVLVDNNGTFAMGDLLEVSGFFDSANVFLATRVEKSTTLENWKIFGYIETANANLITVGGLTFDTTNMVISDCGSTLVVGDLVKIKVSPIMNFDPANTIDSAINFECKNSLVDLPDDQSGDFEFEVEGFVTEVIDADNFNINGQQVTVTTNTIYSNGIQSDIVVGAKLEAEGHLDSTTNILTADKIKFKNIKVRIEAPVAIADLDADQITIMGITGIFNAFTEDKDGLIANGLSADANVEVRGFVDSSGNFFVEELRERGNADFTDVRLRGPIDNLLDNSFSILGVQIDTTGATFFLEDVATDEATFFAALVKGSIVDINHGQYDAETNTLSGGEVTLEDSNDSSSTKQSFATTQSKAGVATVNYGKVTAFAPAQAPTPPPPVVTPTPNTSSGGGSNDIFILLLLLITLGLKRQTH